MRQAQWISWIIATIFVHAITACYYPLQLSEPRSGASIAAVDKKIFFVSSPNTQFASTIDVLDTETNSWSVMQLDPPRTTVIALGIGSRYLFLFGGQLSNPSRMYQFIDVLDVTTNEKYSIPFANGWSNFATPVGVNIHMLQKVVIYVQSATVHESNILVVDPATRSVQEIASDRVRQAVSNGTHLFAATLAGPKALDVDQLTWSDLSDFPLPGNLQLTRWRAYLPSKNAIVVMTETSPPRVQVIALNGTVIGSRAWSRQAFNLVTFSETEIYSIQPGTLTVIRFEDFHEIQYFVPQTFFQGGLFNLFHNGIMYITSLPRDDVGVMTINSNALFTRAQFDLPPIGERITLIAGDILFSISDNISWFDMNTRQYRTQDWPTRRTIGPIAVTGQYVVLAGGIDPNTNEMSNAVDVFDTTTQTWMSTTMPHAFRPGRVYGSSDRAFFFVGRDQFYAYHIQTNSWQNFTMENPLDFDVVGNVVFASQYRTLQITDLSTEKIIREIVISAIGVPVRQRYYFAVGNQGEVVLYDIATDTEQRFHLGVARAQVWLEVVQDRFIVIAGGSPRNRVDVFDMETLTSTSTDLPVYARGNTVLMTVVNDVVIFARHRRIDQFNPATMEFSEIFLEVDDITRVHTRGSKVMFISDYSITIYETSTREYFTARFENYRVLDPSDNFIVARLDGKIEYRPITTMTGVMNSATIFEGDSTTLSTSVAGPYSTVRWSRGDEELIEANDMFNLHIDNAMQSDNGVYQMEVRDLCNQRMQQQARLTVHGRPVFVEPLDDTVNLCDEPSVIETQVVGKNMTLEWRIDGHLQPSMTSENVTIAPNDLQCDRSYSLCLTATNPSGPNTTCASLKLVKVDSLFAGPLPREIQSSWFTGTQVDLEVRILDSDCTSHSWLIDNQTVEEHDAMQSVYRVNVSLLIKDRQFTVVAQCGNSEVRSRPFVFTDVSTLEVGELVVIIIIPIVALIVAAVLTIFFRRRLVKSEHAELELQTLLTQAKTDSLRRDGVSVIPSTKWEWTPTDDFTYRPVDALPCKIDLSMIQMKTEPMRIDVWMQNEMIFSYGAKSTSSSLKERLLDGLQVDIYSPQSPKYEIKVEPSSFVIKEGKSVHVTVSSMMRMTAKCKISLVLVLDQHKMYSAVEYKVESVMSTWIDLDEIQMTGQYLGGGGFGSVTRGVYRGQQVAVKKLLSQYLTPDMKTEFEREVTLMKDLRHPNIVSFVGASNVDDNLAIVLEYAPLGSLSSTMQKMKLSTSMKLTVLYETAKAIQFLHMNSVIHRDIKPQNILVFSLEPKSPVHIKLTDFGTSRFISEDKMTVTKNVGTISYMAPEALGRNPRIDKSADVYSFAILMWEVMFEQQPFAEFQWDSAIEQHVKDGKRLPLSTNVTVNSSLIALIEDCWKQEPSARPQINSIVERLSLLMQ